MTEPNNPQAFPTMMNDMGGDIIGEGGMTLRDYFAGQAITGMVAKLKGSYSEVNKSDAAVYAREAYAFADAMLEARKKGGEG